MNLSFENESNHFPHIDLSPTSFSSELLAYFAQKAMLSHLPIFLNLSAISVSALSDLSILSMNFLAYGAVFLPAKDSLSNLKGSAMSGRRTKSNFDQAIDLVNLNS